jgi:hypothetical protein
MNLQTPKAMEAPNERMDKRIPLVMAMRCEGADSCATATRYVKDQPRPRPIRIGYAHVPARLSRSSVAMRAKKTT